jgi:hypothetical protein
MVLDFLFRPCIRGVIARRYSRNANIVPLPKEKQE